MTLNSNLTASLYRVFKILHPEFPGFYQILSSRKDIRGEKDSSYCAGCKGCEPIKKHISSEK